VGKASEGTLQGANKASSPSFQKAAELNTEVMYCTWKD